MDNLHLKVNARYLGNFDDVGDVQVGGDRWQTFSNEVRLICFLPVNSKQG